MLVKKPKNNVGSIGKKRLEIAISGAKVNSVG